MGEGNEKCSGEYSEVTAVCVRFNIGFSIDVGVKVVVGDVELVSQRPDEV